MDETEMNRMPMISLFAISLGVSSKSGYGIGF
jgi:hypothetical protein